MEPTFEHINSHIFDWLENRPFMALAVSEQQEVLKYFTKEEYDDMHSTAFYIRKSISAGSTSAYLPVRGNLLDTFDKTHVKRKGILSPLHTIWKIAAVFFLFAAGWLCHYLTAYKQNPSALVAETDTVYISQEAVRIYDTVYIEKQDSQTLPGRLKGNQDKLKENRDATELVPMLHMPEKGFENSIQKPVDWRRDDSLPEPSHT